MAKKSDPKEITILLSIDGDTEGLGTAFAALTVNRNDLEWLLRQAEIFRLMKKLEPNYCQATYINFIPGVFESGDEEKVDLVHTTDAKRLKVIFDCELYPTDGWRLAERGEVPKVGTAAVDCGYLIIKLAGAIRPDTVDYYWSLRVNNLERKVITCELKEPEIRALLTQLPPR